MSISCRIIGLQERVVGATRIAVVGIGNELSVSDCYGMLAARQIDALHLPRLKTFLAGTVPESMTGPIRNYRPDHILFFDSADMRHPPGTIVMLPTETIRTGMYSTHTLPLSVVIQYLQNETGAAVTLLGIQPWERDSANRDPCRGEVRFRESMAGLVSILSSR